MGGGGGGNASKQLAQEQQQFATQESQLAATQATQAQQQQQQDLATQAQIASLFSNANGQAPSQQAASKLNVLDYIHTSPEGLLNKPKTGQLNVLGN